MNRSHCISKYSNTNLKLLETDATLLCVDGQGNLNEYGLPYDYGDVCYNCEESVSLKNKCWP